MSTTSKNNPTRTLIFTLLALIAFAGNSVLCRLALGEEAIDAASFTIVRLLSGAMTLALICRLSRSKSPSKKRGWASPIVLFVYAITFSFAYTTLETGTGALILFGCVQFTMLFAAVLSGERVSAPEWAGVLVALGGFVYLVLPGASAPPLLGTSLMAVAGIGWGVFTLLGRHSTDALADNAQNFARTLPLLLLLGLATLGQRHPSPAGVLLAVTSGAITSGLGYSVWYVALRGLTTTTAAVVQLSVPIIAAIGGVLFSAEIISAHLTISAAFILGGIAIVVLSAARRRR